MKYPCVTPERCGVSYHTDPSNCKGISRKERKRVPPPPASLDQWIPLVAYNPIGAGGPIREEIAALAFRHRRDHLMYNTLPSFLRSRNGITGPFLCDQEILEEWAKHDFTPREAINWLRFGMNLEEALTWSDMHTLPYFPYMVTRVAKGTYQDYMITMEPGHNFSSPGMMKTVENYQVIERMIKHRAEFRRQFPESNATNEEVALFAKWGSRNIDRILKAGLTREEIDEAWRRGAIYMYSKEDEDDLDGRFERLCFLRETDAPLEWAITAVLDEYGPHWEYRRRTV